MVQKIGDYHVARFFPVRRLNSYSRTYKRKFPELSKAFNCLMTEMVYSVSSDTEKFSRETIKPHVPIHLDA